MLSIDTWTLRAQAHHALVGPYADAFVKRRGLGYSHPVHDFLFTYYPCSPTKLKQWVPSYEEGLEVDAELYAKYPWLDHPRFRLVNNTLSHNPQAITKSIRELAKFVANLCDNIIRRPPRYTCFGLHEWAMVYQQPTPEVRHSSYKLRLSPDSLASFVDSQVICCSHYDAYRFFTSEARPLNKLCPTIENRLQMEQGGCVHANMDLYKWSTKFWPWIGSDFIATTFMHALEGRELDMRASPYDLAQDGYTSIAIETEEGRREYQAAQQCLAEKAMPIRKQLKAFCEKILRINSKNPDG